ncbi:MAG TPA: YHS domain-containing protein [Cyclobacteriaceae bacterium]|jgi:YHS domain-containing protein
MKGGETKMAQCPVCGMMVDPKTAPSLEYQGKIYFFMNPTHKVLFENNPDKFIGKKKNQMDMGNH